MNNSVETIARIKSYSPRVRQIRSFSIWVTIVIYNIGSNWLYFTVRRYHVDMTRHLRSISHLVNILHSSFLAYQQSAYYISCYWICYMHSGDKYTSPQKCDSSYKPCVCHCLISLPSPLCPARPLWELIIDTDESILYSIFILQLMISSCQDKHV